MPPGVSGTLAKRQESQHPAGLAFLHAIRVKSVQIGAGVFAAIPDPLYPGVLQLATNSSGEINLVVWRTNTWTELRHNVCWIGAEGLPHFADTLSRDVERRAFLAGVHERDHFPNRINEIDRTAISHVNPQRDPGTAGDQAVHVRRYFG